MLFSIILESYSALLSSLTICYIIYRLNTDLKRVPLINYVFSSLSIASIVALINVTMPDSIMGIKIIGYILATVFIIMIFCKHNMYYTSVSALFGLLTLGFGELLVTLVYIYPLKLDKSEFRSSFIHVTVGDLLIFLFSYLILKFISDDFMKARKRIYKNNKRFMVLLFGNLITVFVILIFLFSLFDYTTEFQNNITQSGRVYMNVIIIVAVLIASIGGTIYLINYFLLNRIKYDRLKMNNLRDVMTGTLNRGSGLKFIEEQLELCKEQRRNLTVCYIDVNDLKVINDMLGHREGDFLIKTVICTIKNNIRETDVISRLGGDEFVIVFPGCTMEYSEKVMGRISGELKQLKPFSNKDYTISISYGFSQYDGEADITVEGLLDMADRQMYRNKRAIKAMV
ncbi:GGDEF domain-containing protein [Ruminiclostridium cellobioparum]|uniref:Diguanylate cyclase (GGDEF) domain protein n=1 Tax=Ruminiclostridium cellobioparum subsp. termitidis CT1112 TaxID=1195236 RepID=S0FNV3_RUMCE|nr:GGDEF domain-containing protein [Ruminiclostridium cellobioparum]EMS72051.1 diguanylate cyclase (GGDEF) domain protein [Ruminiclostridium cellobioparum subsp. termitidis CT1112]